MGVVASPRGDFTGMHIDGAGQEFRRKVDVDEAGTGDFHFLRDAVQVQFIDDGLGDFPRVFLHLLGAGHGAVGLIVAESLPGAGRDMGLALGRDSGGLHGFVDAFGEQGAQGHGLSGCKWASNCRRDRLQCNSVGHSRSRISLRPLGGPPQPLPRELCRRLARTLHNH